MRMCGINHVTRDRGIKGEDTGIRHKTFGIVKEIYQLIQHKNFVDSEDIKTLNQQFNPNFTHLQGGSAHLTTLGHTRPFRVQIPQLILRSLLLCLTVYEKNCRISPPAIYKF